MSDEGAARPGVIDFYREVFGAVRARTISQSGARVAWAIVIGLLIAYAIIRTGDPGRPWLILWTAAFFLVCLVAPTSGLTAFVAIAPFSEWLLIDRDTGVKMLAIPILATGVLLRVALGQRARFSGPFAFALAFLAATLASLVHTYISFPLEVAERASVAWLAGIGGGMLVLTVAYWAGARGCTRAVVSGAIAVAVAAILGLVDFLAPAVIRPGPLGWLLRPVSGTGRLMGIIPAPNAVATLLVGGLAVATAWLLFGRPRMRWIAAPAILVELAAIWLTYSRSALVALGALGAILVLRWRPRIGAVVVATGLVVGLVLLPSYLSIRAGSIGTAEATPANAAVETGDRERLEAWQAAARAWLDSPLVGQGFLAFKQIHAEFGSPRLTAPHNEALRVLVDGGLVSFLPFVGFVLMALARLWRTRTAMGLAGLGALLALLIGGSFNNPMGYIQVLGVLMTIIGCALGQAARLGSAEPRTTAQPSLQGIS